MSERRDEQKDRRRGRGPLIAGLVVTIVALLGVIGVLSGRALFAEDERPPEDPAASATPAPTTTKPLVREDLEVVVGEGGSATSEFDPSVPIGYEPTCRGAVEAATNYLIGLDQLRVSAGALTEEKYLALLKDRTTSDYQSQSVETVEAFFERVGDAKGPLPAVHPEWGGFTVLECTEGETARIGIVSASDYAGTGEFYYAVTSTELTWADSDWKVSGSGEADSPATLPEDPVTEPDEEVLTLVGTHTQWENYENAS